MVDEIFENVGKTFTDSRKGKENENYFRFIHDITRFYLIKGRDEHGNFRY